MVKVEKLLIDGIPCLHIVKDEKYYEELPFLIFLHGFMSAKENNLHYAYLLAEKGIRVVLPDAYLHGERQDKTIKQNIYFSFWDIVLASIEEIDMIKKYYEDKKLINVKKIGLAGTSMGGITTFGAITQFDWIQSAASLMGMPAYESFANFQLENLERQGMKIQLTEDQLKSLMKKLRKYDLTMQPEALKHRPLLFWHGKKDEVVPYDFAYQFYLKVDNSKVEFISDEVSGHHVTREGILRTIKWFENQLLIKNTINA